MMMLKWVMRVMSLWIQALADTLTFLGLIGLLGMAGWAIWKYAEWITNVAEGNHDHEK